MSDDLRNRVARAICAGISGPTVCRDVSDCKHCTKATDAALAEIFRSDGNEEARWIEACENACAACGGSGHKDDVTPVALAEIGGVREADLDAATSKALFGYMDRSDRYASGVQAGVTRMCAALRAIAEGKE